MASFCNASWTDSRLPPNPPSSPPALRLGNSQEGEEQKSGEFGQQMDEVKKKDKEKRKKEKKKKKILFKI